MAPGTASSKDTAAASVWVERMVAKFRVSFQAEVEVIGADLQREVDAGEWKRVGKLAHETKNSADLIGASRLADRLKQLEEAIGRGRGREVLRAHDAVQMELRNWSQPRTE